MLPDVTDEEILMALAGGESVAVFGYQARTGTPYPEAMEAVRQAMEDVYAGRRQPKEDGDG